LAKQLTKNRAKSSEDQGKLALSDEYFRESRRSSGKSRRDQQTPEELAALDLVSAEKPKTHVFRKAETKIPKSYSVIIPPGSFADLPEYAASSRNLTLAQEMDGSNGWPVGKYP